ncbi:transcription termination factor Rho [Bombiscardovia coagulans]|uniref:Transcription termination factor Rho n=1 Tax=Bombiscardovia coagulans TaxID=686666 RepID=A0A261EQ60_9BIFI|nr:transcription termination factor Rho [Bombiscardovia coagulans]OZG48989.1 transcription termination factor Rho [Bombiscardovia coagulans]
MATSQDLHTMKLPELKELAKQLGLRGISNMRKPALIETIEAARSGGTAPAGVSVRPMSQASETLQDEQHTVEPVTEQIAQTTTPSDANVDEGSSKKRTGRATASPEVGDLFDVLGIDGKSSRRNRNRQHRTVADDESVIINRRRHRNNDGHSRTHSQEEREEYAHSSKVRDLDDILAALPARDTHNSHKRSRDDNHDRDYQHGSYDKYERSERNRGRNNRRVNRDYESHEDFKDEDLVPVAGIVDVLESYAFIRTSGYLPGPNDIYVSMGQVKKYGLRKGDAVQGFTRPPHDGERRNQRQKFMPLQSIETVNGMSVETAGDRPNFSKLTPLYPQERMRMETDASQVTGRLIDIVAPIGKGQRGLIVSPPKAGKTITLQNIAKAIAKNNPEVHLMVVLVDERPEEVTDMERTVQGEVIASTFDRPATDHTTVAELAIERAKRLVELGQDVVVLLDSMTRLARAYNIAAPTSGRILSGGVDAQALYPPKKFFGAARNIENGGSLTIISSALVETGSKMDEVIFEEFKGTGNMELRLSRELADKRLFPAIDINASGTRREEMITSADELAVVYRLRRLLGGMEIEQAYQTLVPRLKKTATNRDFLGAITQTMLGQKTN